LETPFVCLASLDACKMAARLLQIEKSKVLGGRSAMPWVLDLHLAFAPVAHNELDLHRFTILYHAVLAILECLSIV